MLLMAQLKSLEASEAAFRQSKTVLKLSIETQTPPPCFKHYCQQHQFLQRDAKHLLCLLHTAYVKYTRGNTFEREYMLCYEVHVVEINIIISKRILFLHRY